MIEYAWILTSAPPYNERHERQYYPYYVNVPDLLHRDWHGKPCGGTFNYVHRHSALRNRGWWLCGLCSRKVVAYLPDPLIAAAQEAINS